MPGPVIDLIREGVPGDDLKRRGSVPVWNALVRTASSALQRGWSRPDWEQTVLERKSVLGLQAQSKGGKALTVFEVHKLFVGAWDTAEKWVSQANPAWTREDAIASARKVRDLCADPDLDLKAAERRVLSFAAQEGMRLGTNRPALPWRAVVKGTGLTERIVKTYLTSLHDQGLLTLALRGKRGKPAAGKGKANCYRLPDPETLTSYLYRETRSVGHLAQTCGTPEHTVVGTHAQVCGTPSPESAALTEDKMITLTLTAPDADQLANALVVLAQAGIEVETARGASVANVLPLRRLLPGAATTPERV